MKRQIIKIDEELCNGCGLCVPGCPEGALQVIDGKARLVGELYCDGLGACIGNCPQGAITIEEREAEPYDERKTMENVIKAGGNVIKAHLEHLLSHQQEKDYQIAVAFLRAKGLPVPLTEENASGCSGGCPGSRSQSFLNGKKEMPDSDVSASANNSELSHWPIQLHLLNPGSPHFKKSDFLLAADCTAFSAGSFHNGFLKGKTLGIACPKLDSGRQIYLDKIKALINEALINTLTVLIMEVPCCGGLLSLAKEAVETSGKKIPLKQIRLSITGEVLTEEWI